MKIKIAVVAGALTLMLGNAQATLHDLGNGSVYDDVLQVDWLMNSNLARGNAFGIAGISSTGNMTWDTAQSWISALNAGNYLGATNWRLPHASPANGVSYSLWLSYNGTSDYGYNRTTTGNEMSHLFYTTLGNYGLFDSTGNQQTQNNSDNTFGLFNATLDRGVGYWTDSVPDELPYAAFSFSMYRGAADLNNKSSEFAVWAVRDHTAPVPEPETYAMMLAGLGLLGVMTRRRKQKLNG